MPLLSKSISILVLVSIWVFTFRVLFYFEDHGFPQNSFFNTKFFFRNSTNFGIFDIMKDFHLLMVLICLLKLEFLYRYNTVIFSMILMIFSIIIMFFRVSDLIDFDSSDLSPRPVIQKCLSQIVPQFLMSEPITAEKRSLSDSSLVDLVIESKCGIIITFTYLYAKDSMKVVADIY